MTKRRKTFPIEDETVYEGTVIIPREENVVDQKRETENNHALYMRKLDVTSDFLQIAKQITNIVAAREDSNNRINEMDAEIRRLKQATEHEVQMLQENRETTVKKGEIVANLLSKLTPILADHKLSTEDKQLSIDIFERAINEMVK